MNEKLFGELMSSYILQPVCVINRKGRIMFANSHMNEVFIYDGIEDADFFALTGIKTADLGGNAKCSEFTQAIIKRL